MISPRVGRSPPQACQLIVDRRMNEKSQCEAQLLKDAVDAYALEANIKAWATQLEMRGEHLDLLIRV